MVYSCSTADSISAETLMLITCQPLAAPAIANPEPNVRVQVDDCVPSANPAPAKIRTVASGVSVIPGTNAFPLSPKPVVSILVISADVSIDEVAAYVLLPTTNVLLDPGAVVSAIM